MPDLQNQTNPKASVSSDTDDITPTTTPVLIIGGSLIGLSTAMFLALNGIKTIVVERHAGSSPHPRAIGYTQRTLELFAVAGIVDQIPQVPAGFRLRRAEVESLAGHWQPDTAWTPTRNGQPTTTPLEYSPYSGASIAQDTLEPILRSRAAELRGVPTCVHNVSSNLHKSLIVNNLINRFNDQALF